MHKAIVSIFFAVFAAAASASGVEMPFVSAEGRLAGAYQDTVDAAFVCLVLERGGNFQYAFIKTNDTCSHTHDLFDIGECGTGDEGRSFGGVRERRGRRPAHRCNP